ncbi:protein-disulfide isomerase [alpha proteobacterium U9-1i]|nr:protein-disulfide isomerase [alpha proteobacterium U9-1i]
MMIRTLFAGLAALVALATPAAAQSFNAQEQAEIRAVVRDYLVANPDVLQEALNALETRVAAQRRVEIERDRRDFSIGPADAPITIVEFYDYRCPYCHAAYEWVNDLIRTRRDIRFVFKELPILSPESVEASRAALAAMPQGRYLQFHAALMGFRGELNSAQIDNLARQSGVDVARMRRNMEDENVTALLQDNIAHARNLDLSGTPGFMINGELVPGGFNREALDARLREVSREARRTRGS